MGKTALIVLVVAITMIYQCKGKSNFACTERGGNCSDSNTCPYFGGNVEKLSVRCNCGKACCKCTDTCPDGSKCMREGETCDGKKDKSGCCGNRFCCTPCVRTCFNGCEAECAPSQLREGKCCGGLICCEPFGR
ncbi:uncharacterized protein [Mytilus edulis]|uniref:Uncharacterized protein n=1 Tax=Mytilus galloprovincialis TaxID=29158 RepID=A0A8B6DUJ7_MYTGA|nr:Hypothetical predicted protein [Mytilus galloprovincialis]